jgi:hypothetical protein
VLVQYARVEEYRTATDAAEDRRTSVGLGQHWKNDGAISDVRRTFQRWIVGRADSTVAPGELRDLNYLAHAACHAGLPEVAVPLLRMLDRRGTRAPWSYTGDPEQQFTKWRKEFKVRA